MASGVDKISQIESSWLPDPDTLAAQLVALEQLASQGQSDAVLDILKEAVPTYRPQHELHHNSDVKAQVDSM